MWQLPALTSAGYFTGMLSRRIRTDGFIDPCISTRAAKPPSGPDWVYEIKHDGYRLTCSPAMSSATPTDRRSRLWHERRGAADRYQRRQVGLPEFAGVFDPFAVPADLTDQRLHSTSLLRIRFAVAPSGFRTIQKVVIVCWSSGSRPNR
jgi:hypothetical protein